MSVTVRMIPGPKLASKSPTTLRPTKGRSCDSARCARCYAEDSAPRAPRRGGSAPSSTDCTRRSSRCASSPHPRAQRMAVLLRDQLESPMHPLEQSEHGQAASAQLAHFVFRVKIMTVLLRDHDGSCARPACLQMSAGPMALSAISQKEKDPRVESDP